MKAQVIIVHTLKIFFSSYELLSDLKKKGFRATGTMRKDRVMKRPLIDMKQMKRKERESYDYISNGKIEIVRWNNNSVVTLARNAYSAEPVRTVKILVKGIGKSNVNQPAKIAAYKQGMRGVDLRESALSDLRPVSRSKSWSWPLVLNALNIVFLYSWRVFRIVSGEPMP